MQERIQIKNFAGLKNIDISLNSINIFIGKQAAGKSITAKLIFFFKEIFEKIFKELKEQNTRKRDIDKILIKRFGELFPSDAWPSERFSIKFFFNKDSYIIIEKDAGKKQISIDYSEEMKKVFKAGRDILSKKNEKKFLLQKNFFRETQEYYRTVKELFNETAGFSQVFIPAGRAFFASLQRSIFSVISNNNLLDPFLVEFGSFYESVKGFSSNNAQPNLFSEESDEEVMHINSIISDILGSEYVETKGKDYLLHKDSRKVNVAYSSSGQQEMLPLALILKSLIKVRFIGEGATLYIEEPEAHLFPSAQRKVVELIANIYNRAFIDERHRLQVIITTHSPYILTSFNNLLQAGFLSKNKSISQEAINEIVPKSEVLLPNTINAYSFKSGEQEDLIDEESGLIIAEVIDEVSERIAVQFDELLNLEE